MHIVLSFAGARQFFRHWGFCNVQGRSSCLVLCFMNSVTILQYTLISIVKSHDRERQPSIPALRSSLPCAAQAVWRQALRGGHRVMHVLWVPKNFCGVSWTAYDNRQQLCYSTQDRKGDGFFLIHVGDVHWSLIWAISPLSRGLGSGNAYDQLAKIAPTQFSEG